MTLLTLEACFMLIQKCEGRICKMNYEKCRQNVLEEMNDMCRKDLNLPHILPVVLIGKLRMRGTVK